MHKELELTKIYFLTYILFGLYGSFVRSEVFMFFAAAIGTIPVVILICQSLIGVAISSASRVLLLIGFINLVGFSLSSLYYLKFDYGFFAFLIAGIGIAHIFMTKKIPHWMVKFIFFISAIYFILFMITGQTATIAMDIGGASSRNGVSVIMVNLCVLLYASAQMKGYKITILPAFITFVISAWSLGRSGFIASGFILLYVLYKNLDSKFSGVLKVLIILSLLVLILTIINLPSFYEYIERLSDFEGQEIMLRINFLEDYFSMINSETLLFGIYLKDQFIFDITSNPHNSFVHMHSLIGIFSIFFFVIIAVAITRAFFVNRIYAFLLIALLFRGSTDSIYFFDIFDFILYILVTLCLISTNNPPSEVVLSSQKYSSYKSTKNDD